MTQADVIAALKKHGELTRIELAEHTGINPDTLRKTLRYMKRNGMIESEEVPKGRGSRPHKYRLKT